MQKTIQNLKNLYFAMTKLRVFLCSHGIELYKLLSPGSLNPPRKLTLSAGCSPCRRQMCRKCSLWQSID